MGITSLLLLCLLLVSCSNSETTSLEDSYRFVGFDNRDNYAVLQLNKVSDSLAVGYIHTESNSRDRHS